MVEFDEADWRKRLQQATTGEALRAMVNELPLPPEQVGPPTEIEYFESLIAARDDESKKLLAAYEEQRDRDFANWLRT